MSAGTYEYFEGKVYVAGRSVPQKALAEILIGKIAKRNISLKSVEQCEPEVSSLGHSRQLIKIKQNEFA